MTDRTKLKLMWGGLGASVVLGLLLPATQTTIFVLAGLMCLAAVCAPLMATNKNRKDNA